jgi:hypothetical protein
MENPYDSSPYPPSMAEAWFLGFLRGFADLYAGFDAPAEIAESDAPAYGEGVQAGRQAGIEGLSLGNSCIPAAEESEDAEVFSTAAWSVWSVGSWFVASGGPAGVVARGLVTILRLSLHTKHTVDPQWVLPQLVQPLLDEMQRAQVGSAELYLGIGRDALAADCEFLATGLYPSIDDARSAVKSLGRSDWLIAGWRTDQSNSFRVAEWAEN